MPFFRFSLLWKAKIFYFYNSLMNYEQVIVDYTPGLSEFNETSFSWQRIPNGYDSDSASDWFYAEETKGTENLLPE